MIRYASTVGIFVLTFAGLLAIVTTPRPAAREVEPWVVQVQADHTPHPHLVGTDNHCGCASKDYCSMPCSVCCSPGTCTMVENPGLNR